MIQNVQQWREFECAWVASHKPDLAENLRLVDGMYQLARNMGRFTAADALDGLDKNIRLAAVLHHVRGTS